MKRKDPFIVGMYGLLFLAVQIGYSDENLLTNGGFEEAPGWNSYSNWVVWGNAHWSTQMAFRGTASLAIDDTWLKPHYGGSSQRVSVEPESYYQVSFYYNRESGYNAGNREFEVEWFDADHESLSTITHILGLEGNSGIWQYSGEYEVQAPALASFMEVRFDFSNTEGDAALYIDEVACRRVFPEYGLRNGGFEDPFNGNEWGNWVVEGSALRSGWNASEGRWSLLFPGSWAGASNGLARQRVSVEPGQEYELVFQMIRDNQFQAIEAAFTLTWHGAEGPELFTNAIPLDLSGAEDVWHRVSHVVHAPDGAIELTIAVKVFGAGESGACYLDHIHLAPARSYYTCRDGQIVNADGQPWIPHGIALSGWMFPEAYMWDIDGAGHLNSYSQLRRRIERLAGSREKTDLFWDTYLTNYLTEVDMALLAERGCNSVRIPFNYRELSPENNPGAFLEKGFEQLDRVIRWCAQYGMKVILDMHSCPGGQSTVLSGDPEYMYYTWNEDWNGWEERGVAGLWVYNQTYFQRTGRTPESNIQRTADIWRKIAERYRNEPALLGYELMNEPILPDASWSNLLRETSIQITDAIRSVDPHHLILVQGDSFATRTDGLFPPWDEQMVVAFHYYWEPVSSNRPIVQEYLALRTEWNVPFWLGETGENSNQWFAEMVALMKELDLGWNWWGWKKVESESSVAAAYAIQKTEAMRYALRHFWDDAPDSDLFYEGMMDLAEQVSTERCRSQPDYFNALFRENFLSEAQPFVRHELPARIAAVDYDSGGNGVAWHDLHNQTLHYGDEPGNFGRAYRNDGVDVVACDEEPGHKVIGIEPGEWMHYTAEALHAGRYDVALCVRALTQPATLFCSVNGVDVTGQQAIPVGEEWQLIRVPESLFLEEQGGACTVRVEVVEGDPEIRWIEISLSPSSFVDNDGDGMDDHWEVVHGGNLQPDDDGDEDQYSNREEYAADTDPRSASSLPESVILLCEGRPSLLVPSSSTNVQYTVEYADDLTSGVWKPLTNQVYGTGANLILYSGQEAPARFFRLLSERHLQGNGFKRNGFSPRLMQ